VGVSISRSIGRPQRKEFQPRPIRTPANCTCQKNKFHDLRCLGVSMTQAIALRAKSFFPGEAYYGGEILPLEDIMGILHPAKRVTFVSAQKRKTDRLCNKTHPRNPLVSKKRNQHLRRYCDVVASR